MPARYAANRIGHSQDGQAERERVLYEVTSKIRRSTDVQSILATTASELLKAIGARGTQIRLKAQESSNPNGKGEE